MKNIGEIIKDAAKRGVAVGHFNFATIEGLWAIFEGARNLKAPVIVGTSEGEREFVGVRQAVALVRSLREEFNFPIFLNADHTHSFEKIREAVEAGYDAILFDGSRLSFEENIRETKKVVEFVKSKNPDILVEGELGYIGSASEILEKIPEGAAVSEKDLTKPEEAGRFVEETEVDLFAPAVGNIHGMLASGNEPSLNIARIAAVKKAAGVPLVLHGGSGNTDEDFKAAIKAGISVIHVSTELRVAWRRGMEAGLADKKEVSPYKILGPSRNLTREVVEKKLRVFGV